MYRSDLDAINGILGFEPVEICAGGSTWCERPRYYWVSWGMCVGRGTAIVAGSMPRRLLLEGQRVDSSEWLAKGARLNPEPDMFPAVLTARPGASRERRSHGIETTAEQGQTIWASPKIRSAPYQFENFVWDAAGLRTPNADEREVIMGFTLATRRTSSTRLRRQPDACPTKQRGRWPSRTLGQCRSRRGLRGSLVPPRGCCRRRRQCSSASGVAALGNAAVQWMAEETAENCHGGCCGLSIIREGF